MPAYDHMKILAQTHLADMSFVPEIYLEEIHTIVRQVVTQVGGGLCIGVPLKVVQPSEAGGEIVPTDIRHLLHRCTIVTSEEGQEHLVPFVDRPVQLRIHVVEIERVVAEVLRCLQQQVHISASCRDQHRQFVFHQRPFDCSLG